MKHTLTVVLVLAATPALAGEHRPFWEWLMHQSKPAIEQPAPHLGALGVPASTPSHSVTSPADVHVSASTAGGSASATATHTGSGLNSASVNVGAGSSSASATAKGSTASASVSGSSSAHAGKP